MSGGERPIGAAKGTQSDTEALCQTPPPLHRGRGPVALSWEDGRHSDAAGHHRPSQSGAFMCALSPPPPGHVPFWGGGVQVAASAADLCPRGTAFDGH